MKSLLFIGGTGFLGQSFFDYLNKGKLKTLKLSKIIIVSRKKKLVKSKIKISYIRKSVSNLKKIPYSDYIIYAANSDNNLDNLNGINNFINLLDEKHKKSKILLTSSGAVYGPRNIKKKMDEKEKISFNKVSKFSGYKKEYARVKIIMERKFNQLGKNGYNVSIARLFSFIGKKILINKNFALTNLINQAKNKKSDSIMLSDRRDVYRGYMNSDDLIRWLIMILVKSNTKCKIYNVGSDEEISIENLAKLISYKYNKKVIKNFDLLFVKKKQIIDYYVPSITKAKKELNLTLKYKLNKSLKNLLDYNAL